MALFAKWLTDTIGSTTTPITSSKASAKFMAFYISNSATSGTSVGHYMRLILTGAAGSGVAGRFYTECPGVAIATMHGIQASVGTGESTSAGYVAGAGYGVYAQAGFANNTITGGTYAAVCAELYSWGSSTSIAATRSSFLRCSVGGTANKVDGYAYLIDLVGFTSGTTSTYYDKGSTMTGNIVGYLKIGTPAGDRLIATYAAIS